MTSRLFIKQNLISNSITGIKSDPVVNLSATSAISATSASSTTSNLINPNNFVKTLYCISDVHAEFYSGNRSLLDEKIRDINMPNTDFLILAGDICDPIKQKDMYVELLKKFKSRYKHVLLVPGNHEFYSCDKNMAVAIESLETICSQSDVHLLNKSNVVIDGIRFIGATLWSAVEKKAFEMLSDSRFIFDNHIEYLEEFIDDYKFIKIELLQSLDKEEPIVVVTHHLPTNHLIHARYKHNPASTGYSSNILDNLVLYKVKYWFCGHTHEYASCEYGDTTLVVNPVGYPGENKVTNVKTDIYHI